MAPQVQSLAEVMQELNPAYSASTSVIDKQQANLGAKYDIQRTGLDAKKVQGFNTINNQATGRGMSFSGIPVDEQANYLSTEYLPAYAQTYQQQNDEDLALQGKRADIGIQQAGQAMTYRQQQQSALNSWNLQQMQQQFQAEQNRLDRSAAAAARAADASPQVSLDQALAQGFGAAGTRYNSQGKIVSAANSAENLAAQLAGAGYGSYTDILNKAYKLRKSMYGEG